MARQIVAVVGSYRPGGTTDQAVEAVLAAARQRGAETTTLYLREKHVEFCTNCRTCTQIPGSARGRCVQQDDMESILRQIESADALVLASPVNCFNVTAIFRRFIERMAGYAYWPWGQPAPKTRGSKKKQPAVLITSAAMPRLMIPLCTGAPRALKGVAQILGARIVGKLWIGLAAQKQQPQLPDGVRARARRLGMKLA